MSKGPATEGRLGDLHNKIAEVMISALDNIASDDEAELNPALLSVMVRFLDSNKVTCAPEAGNSMGELEQRLAEKAKKRRSVGNVVHLTDE